MLTVFDETVDSVIRAQRQHLAAILGHQQGVFPLGGVAAILGGHGPAILRIDLAVVLLLLTMGSMVKHMPGLSSCLPPLR